MVWEGSVGHKAHALQKILNIRLCKTGSDPDGVGQQVHHGVFCAGFGPQISGQLPAAGGTMVLAVQKAHFT